MRDDITILSLEGRDSWTAEHLNGGLPSQSWNYARALSASGINPKLAIVHSKEARMVMPFFERDWMGHVDIATILGLSGASITPSSVAPLSLWREYAAAQGWVAGYIQLSTSVNPSDRDPGSEIVSGNSVFLLNLQANDILESASAIVRRKIKKAQTTDAVLVEERSVLAESLKHLYPTAMQRVSALVHYNFSPESLDRWVFDPDSLILGAQINSSVESVSLFSVAGDHAEYHINASSDAGRYLSIWLIWNAVLRLRENGIRTLNLGGGMRPGDGLYQFKQKFHATATPLWSVRQIYDRVRYDELCHLAGVSADDHWFPLYRAPKPQT